MWGWRFHRRGGERSAGARVAAKVRYVIDPDNPYPNNFTGHIPRRHAGQQRDRERQPHIAAAPQPLTRRDIEDKFALNAATAAGRKRASRRRSRARRCFTDGP